MNLYDIIHKSGNVVMFMNITSSLYLLNFRIISRAHQMMSGLQKTLLFHMKTHFMRPLFCLKFNKHMLHKWECVSAGFTGFVKPVGFQKSFNRTGRSLKFKSKLLMKQDFVEALVDQNLQIQHYSVAALGFFIDGFQMPNQTIIIHQNTL